MTTKKPPSRRGKDRPQPEEGPRELSPSDWFYGLEQRGIIRMRSCEMMEIRVEKARKKMDVDAMLRQALNECLGGESRSVLFNHFRRQETDDPSRLVLVGSLEKLTLDGFIDAVHTFRKR